MPYEIHQLPYTDLHSLNLDWLLKKVGEMDSPQSINKLLQEAYHNGMSGSTVSARLKEQFHVPHIEVSTDDRIIVPFVSANYHHQEANINPQKYYIVDSSGAVHVTEFGLYSITLRMDVTEEYLRSYYITEINNSNEYVIFTAIDVSDVNMTFPVFLRAGDAIAIYAQKSYGSNAEYDVQIQSQLLITKLL